MSTQLKHFGLTRTKAWLWGTCLLLAGMLLSTLVFVLSPLLYFAISDSFNWRFGMPFSGQARLETTLRAIYNRGDALIDNQSTLLLGDSHLHSFPTSMLKGVGVNFAIAGETAEQLAERITDYTSVERVKQIVLLTGRNDLAQGRAPQAMAMSVARVLDQIPMTTPVALVGIPPLRQAEDVENRSTQEANQLLARHCSNRARCIFVDIESLADASGSLRQNYALSDGVHLTAAGYTQLAVLINCVLSQPQPNAHGDCQ